MQLKRKNTNWKRVNLSLLALALLSAPYAKADPEPSGSSEWATIVTTPGRVEGAKAAKKVIFKEQGTASLPTDPTRFVAEFGGYLDAQREALKSNGISVLRIIEANEGLRFTPEQKKELKRIAKEHGMDLRLEAVTIDYELRGRHEKSAAEGAEAEQLRKELIAEYQRQFEQIKAQGGDLDKLYWEGVKNLEDSLLAQFFADPRSAKSISSSERSRITDRFRQFWMDIYEPPSKMQWVSGVSKGLIVGALTVAAWGKLGVTFDSVAFWLLTTKMMAVETVFGPYINVYLNFMSRKVERAMGLAGVVAWGHIQGFTLFSADKLVLHFYDPKNITGPWDPAYLLSYFSLASIGGALGGLMPTGITRLMNKGYLTKFWGGQAMQTLDLLMPIEGALMSFGSPWLSVVFGLHQAVKFGAFVVGTALPTRGMLTLTPAELAVDGAVTGAYQFDQMPSPDIAKNREALAAFLAAPNFSLQVKIDYLKYVQDSIKQLGAKEATARQDIRDVIELYLEFLAKDEFGRQITREIEALKEKHDSFTEEQLEPLERFKGRMDGLSPAVMASNVKKQARDRVAYLRQVLKSHQTLAKTLLRILDKLPSVTEDSSAQKARLVELVGTSVPRKITNLHRVQKAIESRFAGVADCQGIFAQ